MAPKGTKKSNRLLKTTERSKKSVSDIHADSLLNTLRAVPTATMLAFMTIKESKMIKARIK